MMHLCKYKPWSEVLDTNTSFNKIQFRECSICSKVQQRRISLYALGNSFTVLAHDINQALRRVICSPKPN